MLTEGTIIIPLKERQRIYNYVAALKSFAATLFNNGPLQPNTVIDKLNTEFTPAWNKKVGNHLATIKFDYDKDKARGKYYNQTTSIHLNLRYLGNARASKEGILLSGIDYPTLTVVLMHEYAHYKRDMKIRSRQYGWSLKTKDHGEDKKSYLRDPDEKLAFAAGYIETLRQIIPGIKPHEVLDRIRKSGLVHDPHLKKLKQEDLPTWKSIMKYAIMAALHDIEAEK